MNATDEYNAAIRVISALLQKDWKRGVNVVKKVKKVGAKRAADEIYNHFLDRNKFLRAIVDDIQLERRRAEKKEKF